MRTNKIKNIWFDAVNNNQLDIVRKMIEDGFNIETTDRRQRTALHIAVANNNLKLTKLLLKKEANIEARMDGGGTPLIEAVAFNHYEIIKVLLKYHADIDVIDDIEWSLMHWAALENSLESADLLLKLNPQLMFKKRWNGISSVHMATSAAMIETLIFYGANIEEKTSEYGSTPLIEATEQNEIEVVKCLIKNGANILAVNNDGESALFIAKKYGYKEIFAFMTSIINPPKNKSGQVLRKKTEFEHNVTMAIKCFDDGLNPAMIEEHARRRVDLFFYILIAYYNTKLVVSIEETNIQHGKGPRDRPACHSSLLTKLWDTRYSVQGFSYRTGILNHTFFEKSLNSTVQLHTSVNYFDTHWMEGKSETNKKMRFKAITILNKVSTGDLNPIQGMNTFMQYMFSHFISIRDDYFRKEELATSPKSTRALIYASQFKGTFFNACGVKTPEKVKTTITVCNDYVQMILGSYAGLRLRDPKIVPNTQASGIERSRSGARNGRKELDEGADEIYQKAYKDIKQEIGIPIKFIV